MAGTNDQKNDGSEAGNSALLPADGMLEIVDVLVAMYRSVHEPNADVDGDRELGVNNTFKEVNNGHNSRRHKKENGG